MMKNLLLISLDTVRADVAYSELFPTIRRLCSESFVFTDAVSSAPLTPSSHATILTGTQPYTHGVRHLFRESLSPQTLTLAEILGGAGWRTGAVVSCPGLNRFYGLGRGFEMYDDEIPPLADGRDPLYVVDVKLRGTALKRADLVVSRSIAWLNQAIDAKDGRPFFLFAHTFDAHWPYEAPTSIDLPVANPYEAEVAFVDHHLGVLFDWLRNRRVLDNTLVVCLSDHGEDLAGWYPNDHAGECGHPEEEGHGALLFDATQHVPLIIRAGEGFSRGVVTSQVRLVDVAPTVLDLLGVAGPPMQGVSLQPLMQSCNHVGPLKVGPEAPDPTRVAYFETFFRNELAQNNPQYEHLTALRGVRIDSRFKVVWEHVGESIWVYDLAHDPNEQAPAVFSPWSAPASQDYWSEFDTRAYVQLAAGIPSQPALHVAMRLIENVARAVAAVGGTEVTLSGSFASGNADQYSDVDLEIACVTPAARSRAKLAAVGAIEASGIVLASFPATHLGLPHLMIHFVEIDGVLAKIDLAYSVRTPEQRPGLGLVLVRPACAEPMSDITPMLLDLGIPHSRPTPNSEPELFIEAYQRLVGWAWYTHTKIERGELWEADDSLSVMRARALMPLLLFARGLPQEGNRRLESRLGLTDQVRLQSTRPAGLARDQLHDALLAMIDLADSIAPTVASKLGREFRLADLTRMRHFIAKVE